MARAIGGVKSIPASNPAPSPGPARVEMQSVNVEALKRDAPAVTREAIMENFKFSAEPPAALPGTVMALAEKCFSTGYRGDFGARGRLNCRPVFGQGLVNTILEAVEADGGPLWTPEDIEAQRQDCRTANLAIDFEMELSFDKASRLFQRKLELVTEAVARGEKPDLPIEHTDEQLARYRDAVHACTGAISNRVFERLKPKCERIAQTAFKMAKARYGQETAGADKMGVPFAASSELKALVWFALQGASEPILNYLPGMGSLKPHNTFWGITLFPAEPCQAMVDCEAERKAILDTGERLRREARELAAKRSAEQLASKSEAHRAELARVDAKLAPLLAQFAKRDKELAAKQAAIPTVRILE